VTGTRRSENGRTQTSGHVMPDPHQARRAIVSARSRPDQLMRTRRPIPARTNRNLRDRSLSTEGSLAVQRVKRRNVRFSAWTCTETLLFTASLEHLLAAAPANIANRRCGRRRARDMADHRDWVPIFVTDRSTPAREVLAVGRERRPAVYFHVSPVRVDAHVMDLPILRCRRL
jgi:hypothetical protein